MTADTAKCAGNSCPIREQCQRFVVPAVDGQEWLVPTWREFTGHAGQRLSRCMDRVPLAVQPHGGAIEEVDGA